MNKKQIIVISGLGAYVAAGLFVAICNFPTFIQIFRSQINLLFPIFWFFIPVLFLGGLLIYFFRNKSRILIIFLLLFCLAQPSAYAVNIFNRVLYEKVILKPIHRYVLVNRLSGEVEYIMRTDNRWAPIAKPFRHQYQSMYDYQTASQQ
jgi:hypothetical protein